MARSRKPAVRVLSWNVNGLRAIANKGFHRWLAGSQATIVGIQEIRARPEQLPDALREPEQWRTHFVPAERPGYSGVGMFSQLEPDRVEAGLGDPRFDCEGRIMLARFGRLIVVNVYFPNGNGRERDNSRVPYKLEFYRALFAHLEPLRRAGEPVLVMGDLNT
ncbi:MAG TPA: exodeoxyribonuclease III, partial [Enhygromyxa sp.]|nr:exodeoxyribonuclease III [Enhygromyxa sp.]